MRALYVLLEHRYYGKSQPTKNISTDNLRFLSSRQALKDAVYFRKFLTKKLKLFRNKWVVFGGSYSGSLAAWLRVKHPRMFHSAVAYSAPIYAKANFSEYLEVIQKALFRYGQSECVDAVRNASQVLMHMLKHKEYHSNISRDFRFCYNSSIDSEKKMSYFIDLLVENIAGLVQYSRERPLNKDQTNYTFDQKLTTSDLTLNYFCGVMTAESLGTPYERYAYFANKYLEADNKPCQDANYDKYIAMMRKVDWDGEAAIGMRQWLYQTCTEFGFFQTTDSKHQPFLGKPLSYFIDQCQEVFDSRFDLDSLLKSIKKTNKHYYMPLIRTGRRILFPNGDLDPWHALSINSRRKRNLVGISIKNSSHCEAMSENDKDDPQNLENARHFIFRTLFRWLKWKN
ncbi:putative serine protease K12H4.7 isoform X2 [Macrotis lagotis]